MKNRFPVLFSVILLSLSLCACGRMTHTESMRPEESIPPIEMPDVDDGIVDDRDGVIEDDHGIKDDEQNDMTVEAPVKPEL